MSVASYQKAQKVAESPRQMEYRLFAQITGELIAARDQGLSGSKLAEPLHRNREMWTVLANDCGAKGNNLPDALRANIISISLWVNKFTTEVIRGAEKIDELINVNRNVMEGLAPAKQPVAA
jgi:flagellar protein FlaF